MHRGSAFVARTIIPVLTAWWPAFNTTYTTTYSHVSSQPRVSAVSPETSKGKLASIMGTDRRPDQKYSATKAVRLVCAA